MRVLVTGASSLLGRHTVSKLLARGDHVTALQRNHAGLASDEVLASITDPQALAAACIGQDAIVHLAAKVGVAGEWAEYEHTNVGGTARLLEAAQGAGVGGFVHVSSPSVAHAGHALIGAGADPADPATTRGFYATSKAMAERCALDASSTTMPVVAIRPHLVWGPGDTQLVGRIIERAHQSRLALVGPGMALVDSTYVENAAGALVAAVDRVADLGGRPLVVSNGEPRTVQELVGRILAAVGVAWTPRHVPTPLAVAGGAMIERLWARTGRTDDPPMTRFLAEQLSTAHWFDQRETRRLLQWEPQVSLAEGFAALEAWHRSG